MTEWPHVKSDQDKAVVMSTDRVLPFWVRFLLIFYGILLLATGGAFGQIYVAGQKRDARQIEQARDLTVQLRSDIFGELDRRTAQRNAEQERDRLQQRSIICAVISGDLRPSERTAALAASLGCPP